MIYVADRENARVQRFDREGRYLGEWAQYDFARKRVDSCVRLSPHYYNTEAEVAEAVVRVAEIAREPEA